MAQQSPIVPLLNEAYLRNGDLPVAFIDETSRSKAEHPGEKQFYVMTGVVVHPQDFEVLREDLRDIAQSDYWHTTDNLSSSSGRKKVLEMLQYLADGDEISIISHLGDSGFGDEDIEAARETTLLNLSQYLFNDLGMKLAVLERRNPKALVNRDERTFARAKRSGVVPRNTRMLQVSPSTERLLWLPDLVASAIRQELARGDHSYVNLIKEKVVFLDASRLKESNP
ncbi:hypothetical protein M2119_001576 [Aurantimicrobium minutum]|uniref:hypothetical protein n=1 Tax=Aurantimicrobium minutum TaxID=708131 RepID=UPI0024768612|nr:hypothetical protein [Aurantimicrobium minutum]MDH6533339.1 hypothetical protein [Aurantimicrobium minutum]